MLQLLKDVDKLSNNAPIGVFDSGLGGLTVWREVRRALPAESLVYLGDGKNCPYGSRPREEVRRLADEAVAFLVAQGCKLVVVACNTATSAAIDRLRAEFPFPVIGIEPAVKPAVRMTKDGVVGVLATTRTITSNRLESLIERFAGNDRVIPVACPGLMEQVEAGEFHTPKTRRIIEKYVGPLIDQGADTLVLGCTHYPFLADEIQAVAGKDVVIIDPSPAVARFLAQRLTEEGSIRKTAGASAISRFWCTGNPDARTETLQKLWSPEVRMESLEEAWPPLRDEL